MEYNSAPASPATVRLPLGAAGRCGWVKRSLARIHGPLGPSPVGAQDQNIGWGGPFLTSRGGDALRTVIL